MALSETLSAAAALAREILRSEGVTFFFDFMLVKEPGNSLTATRRRALSTCWFGDNVRCRDKPYETDPPGRGEGLVPGGPMAFPRIL